MAVNLGDKVRDTITGMTGIAVVKSEHLNGCIHIAIEPTALDKDGKTVVPEFFDIQRVEVLEPGAFQQHTHTEAPIPGGPGPTPPTPSSLRHR